MPPAQSRRGTLPYLRVSMHQAMLHDSTTCSRSVRTIGETKRNPSQKSLNGLATLSSCFLVMRGEICAFSFLQTYQNYFTTTSVSAVHRSINVMLAQCTLLLVALEVGVHCILTSLTCSLEASVCSACLCGSSVHSAACKRFCAFR